MTNDSPITEYDIFIIGGGINGCGIARDAAGRGLSVALAERDDLASATSSASTKLFHGGLRYLEYFKFRLVKEALKEREILLKAMPHISWPMRFVLPYHSDQRFDAETPTSKLLSTFMPWLRGRRPGWLIRLGLFLYDTLGGRDILPVTTVLDLRSDPAGRALNDKYQKAFEYSDCWVQDSRLVVLNARDAAGNGAHIMTRSEVTKAEPQDGVWLVTVTDKFTNKTHQYKAKVLINAAGPWVGDVLRTVVGARGQGQVRLVRGSHIVTRKLYDHEKCYFFQGADGRIIFAIPYEQDFTLIGTTDAEHLDSRTKPEATQEEIDYLIDFSSEYFKRPIVKEDIVWTYSGVRPLYDDGSKSATAATRDYVLKLENTVNAPLLNVFGGKITTYRRLAEAAIGKLRVHFPQVAGDWTADAPLPGGDFPVDGVAQLEIDLRGKYPFLSEHNAKMFIKTYGTDAQKILVEAEEFSDLGQSFGAGISARELDWVIENEWVKCAEDFVWRRTRLGLRLSVAEIAEIDAYIRGNCTA